jgi:hypothetical protein
VYSTDVISEKYDPVLEKYDMYGHSGDYGPLIKDLAGKSYPIYGPKGVVSEDDLQALLEVAVPKVPLEKGTKVPWPEVFEDYAKAYDGPNWTKKRRNAFKMMTQCPTLIECVTKWGEDVRTLLNYNL